MKFRMLGCTCLLFVVALITVVPYVRGDLNVTFTVQPYATGQNTEITANSFPLNLQVGQVLSGTVQSSQPVWVFIVTASAHDAAQQDPALGLGYLQKHDLLNINWPITQLTTPDPLYWTCSSSGQYYMIFMNTGNFPATVTINASVNTY